MQIEKHLLSHFCEFWSIFGKNANKNFLLYVSVIKIKPSVMNKIKLCPYEVVI